MPTFNQLVRKGREVLVHKSTAPALQKSYNTQKKAVHQSEQPSEAWCLHRCAYHDPKKPNSCSA